ncbi:MAG: hypothetical protein R3176_02915 [Woeseiaceae bacterium]|nr:hypothetical protein [Woeseiaceae bacterium]
MKLYAELVRRNVIRVGIAYVLASWVVLQIVDVVFPILELPAWAPKLILVLLAVGLVPVLIFAWVYELTPEGVRKESAVDRSQSIAHHTGRKLDYVIIGTLAIAVMLLLAERFVNRPADTLAEPTAAVSGGIQSIAVLPFVNMSSDPEQEFFSDGITEEILNALASVKQLKVAGRTSSFAFKGESQDLRRIGDALGVRHILEGSVRKAGDQVRITAQLIQVDDGFHLWSETYDRKLTDVFAIQEEIAREILIQLKSQLFVDGAGIDDSQRTDPEVYELYLRAKQRLYTRERGELELAVDELDRAIRTDPGYAPIYAQRGIATMLLSEQQYGTIPDDEASRRAKRFIDRALAIDDGNAEAWAALGLYYATLPGQNALAVDPLTKALAINPNLIDASHWLNITLQGLGDFRGALEILEGIAERDPLYRPAFSNAITLFNAFGAPEKAEALLRRLQVFDPGSPEVVMARGINLMFSGRMGEGLLEIERRRELAEMSGIARIYLSLGLLSTMQYERAANEGSMLFLPESLFNSGRKEEAFRVAYEQAQSGYPGNLLYLFLREGRERDLIRFIEERWPTLESFRDEVPGDFNGYPQMLDVAFAYKRTSAPDRFAEAMRFVEQYHSKLLAQGLSSGGLSLSLAKQYALVDERDTAIQHLGKAVARGWRPAGRFEDMEPVLASLADDPRMDELRRAMLDSLNRDRLVVGLPPVNSDYEPIVAAN